VSLQNNNSKPVTTHTPRRHVGRRSGKAIACPTMAGHVATAPLPGLRLPGKEWDKQLPKPLVLCLMGPTASGKTALAVELVQQLPLEIVSIDSAMIYRGMDVGSAKPSADVLARAPHHLIDCLDPPESYSAAQCCEDVHALCQEIIARGHIPLLTGGTMLYFRALQQGLSSLPEADASIRESLLATAEKQGWAYMHAQLAQVDPVSAKRIHPHDTQRIQRALEVYQLTQVPLSDLWNEPQSAHAWRYVNWVIMPEDRAWLHTRIATRFQQMLADGFIEEVEQLIKTWPLSLSNPSMRCVGYRQVFQYLQGEMDKQSLLDKGIAATRQLAKRQLTWLRHWPEKNVLIAEDSSIVEKMLAQVNQVLVG
jgi:tRNA dimethylallyltransferase